MGTEWCVMSPGRQWYDVYAGFSNRDIFYNPDYYRINGEYAGWDPKIFVFTCNGTQIIYPYLKKSMHTLEFLRDTPLNAYADITTLEYGGPISEGLITPEVMREFTAAFSEHCVDAGIVSEYARFNPFSRAMHHLSAVQHTKDVFYIDMTKPRAEITHEFKKSSRNAITKAGRERVEIYDSRRVDDLESFYHIYTENMRRKGADMFYFYSIDYMKAIVRELGRRIRLIVAAIDGEVIAGSFFLYDNKTAHYYLSALAQKYKSAGATNLTLSQEIMYAKEQGYLTFNLGGGYVPGDGLEWFKRSFTRTFRPFYSCKKVHAPHIYKQLSQIRGAWAQREQKPYNLSYFPEYRG